jgi:hypothetical protein
MHSLGMNSAAQAFAFLIFRCAGQPILDAEI